MRLTLAHRSCRSVVLAAAIALFPILSASAQTTSSAPAAADDPFARRGWHIELAAHGALETWNYNISHEEMLALVTGVSYGLGKGVVIKLESPLYRVWQRGTDGYLLGLTWGVRSRVLRRPRWSLFWEVEVGVSDSDTPVPPGGTRFNYVVLGGSGVSWRLKPRLHALAGLRWVHVSNNSLAGRNRNPDIEAVGPVLGVLVGF